MAIKKLAKPFQCTAKTSDGIIELFEHPEKFIVGVQWHPEMMAGVNKKMLNMFKILIEECTK